MIRTGWFKVRVCLGHDKKLLGFLMDFECYRSLNSEPVNGRALSLSLSISNEMENKIIPSFVKKERKKISNNKEKWLLREPVTN